MCVFTDMIESALNRAVDYEAKAKAAGNDRDRSFWENKTVEAFDVASKAEEVRAKRAAA